MSEPESTVQPLDRSLSRLPHWWAAAGVVTAWGWTLFYLPAGVAVGSGALVIFSIALLILFGRRQDTGTELAPASDVTDGADKPDDLEALLADHTTPGVLPQVDDVLRTMADEQQQKRLENLLRRWVSVAQQYSEANLQLRKQIHSVVAQIEQAASTIANSFQAIINKATVQAQQAMDLLEGTQGAADDGTPQSLKDFIRVSDERLTKMSDEVVRVADLSVRMVKELDGVQKRTQAIDGFLMDVEKLADQTSLLALNADIEASRVGEAGRGFSVVAKEVRRLSKRSNEFSDRIRGHLSEVRVGLNKTYGDMRELSAADVQHAVQIKNEILTLTRSLEGKNREVAETVSSINAISREIAQDVQTVVVSLQFHDITSQQLNGMLDPLDDLRRTLFHLMQETLKLDKSLLTDASGEKTPARHTLRSVDHGEAAVAAIDTVAEASATGIPASRQGSSPSVELF